MCGFAGLWTTRPYPSPDLEEHVRRMIDPLAHRGPDDSGTWIDSGAGFGLGFRRLSILDLTPSGHQPMRSASGRYVIAFNGEIYNFGDLRVRLEADGIRFRGGSDTEVILAAFDRWGLEAAVRRFVGMFAMAVWDRRQRQLLLLRDRLGKKPLYVNAGNGIVTFGSELKALAAGPAFDKTIDQAALGLYLRYLYIPAPRTIFRGVMKVPPGHILTMPSAGGPLPPSRPYWSLRDAALDGLDDPLPDDDREVVDRLETLLTDAVRCRMRADVPLGALLSGGVDSSTVVALMQEASARPVRTYTIGFTDGEFDESVHAEAIAAHVGTDHTHLRVTGEDALAVVPSLTDVFDEPLADPSQIPTLMVSRLARREVTVALCGDGGDELFGGYNRYVYGTRLLPRLARIPQFVRRSMAGGLRLLPRRTWDGAQWTLSRLSPSLPAQRMHERVAKIERLMREPTAARMYRSLLSAWPQPAQLMASTVDLEDPAAEVLDQERPPRLLDRMMLADQATYLPDDLLAKVDRASMAASLEVRTPLLDHRLVEFSWRVPPTMKLRNGQGKWVLRQVLYRRIPREIIDRPKMGFSVPIDRWLRGPLRAWAGDHLAVARTDAYVDAAAIEREWSSFQRGEGDHGLGLWAVALFQAWRARWVS